MDDSSDPRSDGDLLSELRAGDVRAFETLFLRHHPSLCSFAKSYVGSEVVAEDLVQDIFLYAWKKRIWWMLEGSEFRRYLFTAVRNAAISHLRHREVALRKSDEITMLLSTPEMPDQATYRGELATAVRCAISKLPGRCREVITLHRDQGLSYREIAEILGIAEKTVEVHMGRAFKLLREALSLYRS